MWEYQSKCTRKGKRAWEKGREPREVKSALTLTEFQEPEPAGEWKAWMNAAGSHLSFGGREGWEGLGHVIISGRGP